MLVEKSRWFETEFRPAGDLYLVLNPAVNRCLYSHPVIYVYHKMLLNENESYLVLMSRQKFISND